MKNPCIKNTCKDINTHTTWKYIKYCPIFMLWQYLKNKLKCFTAPFSKTIYFCCRSRPNYHVITCHATSNNRINYHQLQVIPHWTVLQIYRQWITTSIYGGKERGKMVNGLREVPLVLMQTCFLMCTRIVFHFIWVYVVNVKGTAASACCNNTSFETLKMKFEVWWW